MHPHRPRLSNLVAVEIREGIAQSRWTGWLPQERTLAEELCASRSVVRQALELLKKEQIIESFQSRGHRIVSRRKRSASKSAKLQTIALLTPASLEDGRPLVTLPIDYFRQQLMKENCQLQIIESKSCFKKNPETALATLRAHSSIDCWLLRLSTKRMQEWFQKQDIPTVVLGTCHDGVSLPSVDVDRKALAHHAVGVLIKAGHRQFTLLINKDGRGGDVQTERGFREALAEAQKHHPDLNANVVYHEESIDGILLQVAKLLARHPRPTAIFVAQPTFYLTVSCDLARRGIKVPADISLITQVGGPYLSYMLPQPARYHVDSQKFARKLLVMVLGTLHRETIASQRHMILPSYVGGPSLRQIPNAS